MPNTAMHIIANHAAPVLAGKKPSALFTVKCGLLKNMFYILNSTNLKTIVMRIMNDRLLILVYDPYLLAQTLNNKTVLDALSGFGYPINSSLPNFLKHLKKQFADSNDFPHEIGFFLGYPPQDVIGYIEHGGKNCKYCGMWKVYGCTEHAKTLCEEYQRCKQLCCRHLELGGDLKTFKLPA